MPTPPTPAQPAPITPPVQPPAAVGIAANKWANGYWIDYTLRNPNDVTLTPAHRTALARVVTARGVVPGWDAAFAKSLTPPVAPTAGVRRASAPVTPLAVLRRGAR